MCADVPAKPEGLPTPPILARIREGLIGDDEVMPGPFTIEDGSMTPTLKLRRQIIYQRHAALFESLYQSRASGRAAAS